MSLNEALAGVTPKYDDMAISPKLVHSVRQGLLQEHAANVSFVDCDTAVKPGTLIPWSPVYCSGSSKLVTLHYYTTDDGIVKFSLRGNRLDKSNKTSYAHPHYLPQTVYHHFLTNGRGSIKYSPFPHLRHQCACLPGPSIRMLSSTARVIGNGGGRGSGKTDNVTGVALRPDKFGVPLINYPDFRMLVIRKNYKDIMEIMDRLFRVLKQIDPACQRNKQEGFIELSNGARIDFEHMANSNSMFAFHGKEYWTIFVDELQLLESQDKMTTLLLSNRTKHEDRVDCKFYATFNPGGDGAAWIRDYWIKPRVSVNGTSATVDMTKKENWGKIVVDSYTDPDSGIVSTVTREFILSTVYDNPYLRDKYLSELSTISDPVTKAQMLYGDFEAAQGQYFKTFRVVPLPGEPENAQHVYPPNIITSKIVKPWNTVFGSMDWGHAHLSVAFKIANADPKIVFYDEVASNHVEAVEWGKFLAHWWMPELDAGKHVMIFLSHDAFRDQDFSTHKLLTTGARSILGRDKVAYFDKQVTEGNIQEFTNAYKQHCERASLVFVNSGAKSRVFGWEVCRSMMVWQSSSVYTWLKSKFNEATYKALIKKESFDAAEMYKDSYQDKSRDLPKLVISSKCTGLINAIPTAVYDTDGSNPEDLKKTATGHDDYLDAFRYGCVGSKFMTSGVKPLIYHMQDASSLIDSMTPDPTMRYLLKEREYETYKERENSGTLVAGDNHLPGLLRPLADSKTIETTSMFDSPEWH